MKVLIFAALFGLAASAPTECPQSEHDQANLCMADIIVIGTRGAKFPEVDSDVSKYCTNVTNSVKCVKDFAKKCVAPFPKQLTHMILLGAGRVSKRYCKDPAKHATMSEHGKCANTGIEAAHICVDGYIDDIQGSMKGTNDLKIPINCCVFNKFKNCIVGAYTAVGPATCPQKSVAFIESFIDDLSRDALDLVCSDYKDAPAKCNSIAIPTKDVSVKRTASYYSPLVEVFASIA